LRSWSCEHNKNDDIVQIGKEALNDVQRLSPARGCRLHRRGLRRSEDQDSLAEGRPNIEARDDIKITDVAPIIRTVEGARGEGDLVQGRWSWPGPQKRPVYNFRSDGREFASNRCLIVADGFYEFTDPKDAKKKRKDKWLFTKKDEPLFCIAGIWRNAPEVGEAFTRLTMEPRP
jgi:putative SOS response-associated peptidase YedK